MNEAPPFLDFPSQEKPADSSIQNPANLPIDDSLIDLSFSDPEEQCVLTPQEFAKALFDDEGNQDNSSQLPNHINTSWPTALDNNATSIQNIHPQPNDSSDILQQTKDVPLETFMSNPKRNNNESRMSTYNTTSQRLQLDDNNKEKFDQMSHPLHQPVFPISSQVPQINMQNYHTSTPSDHPGKVEREKRIQPTRQRNNKRMRSAWNHQQQLILDRNQSIMNENSSAQIDRGYHTGEEYPHGTTLISLDSLFEKKSFPVHNEKERMSEPAQNQMLTHQSPISTASSRLPEQTGNMNEYNIQVLNPMTPLNRAVVHVAPPILHTVRTVQVPNMVPIPRPVNTETQLQPPPHVNFHTALPFENREIIPQPANLNNGNSAEDKSRSQRQKRRLVRKAATTGKRQKQNSSGAVTTSRGKQKSQKQPTTANRANQKQNKNQTKAKQSHQANSSKAAANPAKNESIPQSTAAAGPSSSTGGRRAVSFSKRISSVCIRPCPYHQVVKVVLFDIKLTFPVY